MSKDNANESRRLSLGDYDALLAAVFPRPYGKTIYAFAVRINYPLKKTAACIALACASVVATTVWCQDAIRQSRDDVPSVVAAARGFLEDWYLRRDIDRAQAWFADAAYRHSTLLNAECVFGNDTAFKTEAARRAAVQTFLREGLPDAHAKTLTDVVSPRATQEFAEEVGKRLVNDPSRDRFVVATMDRNERTFQGAENEELRNLLPSTFYVTFVVFDGGAMYFFWLRESAGWRIVHANLICV